MQFQDKILCDFCFEQISEDGVCANCGLTHESYHLDGGLLAPGTNLMGKYIIGRVLGRGGFGATYLAYSAERASRVAIKEYFPVSIVYRAKGEENVTLVSEEQKEIFEKGAQRFFDEAQTISRFNMNPNIVSVYEFFNANSTVYYSMEYLEGTDLKKYIASKGGRLVEHEVISITKSVCNALMVVHSAQFLHRDISPDNIFMCANGGVKLIDFGTAKQVIANEHQSYSVVVKQGFAPAEQYTRKGNQGVWTDVYALGATMYYTLLGRVPPDSIDRVDEPELNFSSPYSDVTSNFCAVINKCMAMQKELRYQSVVDLIADLDRVYSMTGGASADIPMTNGGANNTTTMGPTGYVSTQDLNNLPKPKGIAAILANKKLMAIIGGGVAACVALCILIVSLTSKPSGGMSGGGGGGGGATSSVTEQTALTSDPSLNAADEAAKMAAEQEAAAEAEQKAAEAEVKQNTKKKTTQQKTNTASSDSNKTTNTESTKVTQTQQTTTQTTTQPGSSKQQSSSSSQSSMNTQQKPSTSSSSSSSKPAQQQQTQQPAQQQQTTQRQPDPAPTPAPAPQQAQQQQQAPTPAPSDEPLLPSRDGANASSDWTGGGASWQ